MMPTLRHNQVVLVSQVRNFKQGDVVVAFMDGREVIKRITRYQDGQAFLEGDNKEESTDSRTHGWLVDRHVEGKVIFPRVRLK
jgi:phage repressor protein C with HTH and peptisase S24 domain